ncbi:efflux RND transporter periplasmic adaptor subunit [Geomonas paludis]|uniref:Efflux RND transporter periplasmic adaptor subunit n=1 Tax=Geomonas paludis TaxID=2740185 RepID=A0A6V8MV88_9BACT|nr:efflux RND transporter periplasmic adaptor subunit [Geomonas paludis]UPU38002.1 efflux RND transporter periplasmic adaptor subunit [Geomonas paludis]GFO63473.1 hypothetical protein GMPD_13920 [Geomonas paludis]
MKVRVFVVGICALLFLAGISAASAVEEFEGVIYPSEVVKVSSSAAGILEEVTVERGDLVRKGQVLARLKSGQERAARDLALANVEFLRRKMERNAGLVRKKLVSANENDELETDLRKAQLQLEELEEKLKSRTVVSTIDGVVTERLMAPGDYVGEAPIFKLACLDPLRVDVVIPVRSFGLVKRGMRAEIRPEAPVGGRYYGRVAIVDKVVDAASSTFMARVDVANPSMQVPSGLRCRVRFLR